VTDPRPGERRILIWMCVFIGVNQLGFGALIPVLPLYAQAFGVPASAIGSTIAIYGLARLFVALPGGRISDRHGRRPAMALGATLSCLGNVGCALAHSFPEFLVARFIAGAGAGLVLTVGSVVLADISVPERRGRMMATYQGVFLFAVGIGPLPGGLLAERFGLAAPFAVYAAAAAIAGAVAWFAVPETRHFGTSGKAPAGAVRVPFHAQMRLLASNTGFLLVSLLGLANAIVRTGGLFNVVPVIGAVKLGLGAGQIGSGFALGSVLGLLASYPAGALADRYGRKPIIVPSSILTGVSLLAFCVAPSYGWFVAACVVWGIASAVNGAAPAAYAADNAPQGMNAAAMGSYRMLADIGYVIGPIGFGLMVDFVSPEASLFAGAALIMSVGLLFARFAPESLRRTVPRR
jgi:MFS family permease